MSLSSLRIGDSLRFSSLRGSKSRAVTDFRACLSLGLQSRKSEELYCGKIMTPPDFEPLAAAPAPLLGLPVCKNAGVKARLACYRSTPARILQHKQDKACYSNVLVPTAWQKCQLQIRTCLPENAANTHLFIYTSAYLQHSRVIGQNVLMDSRIAPFQMP